MSGTEWPEPTVSGLTLQELVDLLDSLDPNWVGRFDSFEALVRYAEAGEIPQKSVRSGRSQ
jgi:hypothetical protein